MFITKLHDLSSAINNSEDRKLTKTKLNCNSTIQRAIYDIHIC